MQFGIGLLGNGFDQTVHDEQVLADTRPPHPNFGVHADRFAAALAARTIFSDPSTQPDLSDGGIVDALKRCVRPVRRSEAPMVRDAFRGLYADGGEQS